MKIIYLLRSSLLIWLGTCTASSVSLALNDTTSNNITVPPGDINCYRPEDVRVPITIDKCRSLLNLLPTFPRYRAIQDFQTGRSPRLPGALTPPYTWWNSSTTCGLRVESYIPSTVQKFAWQQVRALAMDIIDYCQETSLGLGGYAPIGIPRFGMAGFSVRVVGVTIPPMPPPDGTDDAFGSSGTANTAVGETLWFDTS